MENGKIKCAVHIDGRIEERFLKESEIKDEMRRREKLAKLKIMTSGKPDAHFIYAEKILKNDNSLDYYIFEMKETNEIESLKNNQNVFYV